MLPESGNHFSEDRMLNFLQSITFMRLLESSKTRRDRCRCSKKATIVEAHRCDPAEQDDPALR